MDFKLKVQEDFVKAMKNRDEVAKSALSSLKAQILLADKTLGSKVMDESTFWAIVTKMIAQREESAKIFSDAGRDELSRNELSQAEVLGRYLPKQMTTEEVRQELVNILDQMKTLGLPLPALKGKTLGQFNRNFRGKCHLEVASNVLAELLS